MIYTTGAFLTPIIVNGQWVWMVSRFNDDTFRDGEVFNPPVCADTIEKLETEETWSDKL